MVKVIGALDRYHGLAAADATGAHEVEPRRLSRASAPLALTRAALALKLIQMAVQKVAKKGA
jgi:hypothetical protein